jgi:hypothetical protein
LSTVALFMDLDKTHNRTVAMQAGDVVDVRWRASSRRVECLARPFGPAKSCRTDRSEPQSLNVVRCMLSSFRETDDFP